jgi:cellulose synthase/poly-beta-1,6-N-acetylglucosamine synthase-like glycosyltransferase
VGDLALNFLGALYILSALAIALFASQGIITLVAFWRHRSTRYLQAEIPLEMLPRVTVQLPIFNERFVARRLIDAAVALNYPIDRLEIQVLDDSVDETTAICAGAVEKYRHQGFNIKLLHRNNRVDYKAGALLSRLRESLLLFSMPTSCPRPAFYWIPSLIS